MGAPDAEQIDRARNSERLPTTTKIVYGMGDHTVNLALSSLSFIFPWFLTEIAGVTAGMAGLVPLVGRAVDAFSDPAMGRLSDQTRWRSGRRRPYLLIGMFPFGLAYAALWWDVPVDGQWLRFAYYAAVYALFALAMTVISVPYLSLIPELTQSYQERTSINAYRSSWAILGTLLAVTTMRPLAEALGGGREGFALAGMIFGAWMVLPWIPVFAVSFERKDYQRPSQTGFVEGLRSLAGHSSYRTLVGLYLLGRVAIDLATVMFLYYFTYWLGRPDDFEITMGLFLVSVVVSFPFWVRISKSTDKRTIFLLGAASWIVSQVFLLAATPDWPRLAILVGATIAGVGYAAADMIPWSMLGEVVDEDELLTGERREGLYYGFFTFLRKLGGAGGVALALWALELSGYVAGQPQDEATLWTIRVLTAGAPGVFVLLAALVALRYPLSRRRHQEILEQLHARRLVS